MWISGDFWSVLSSPKSERFGVSHLNIMCSQDFSDQVLPVEPWNKMQVLICRCLQALAEALKINASVTTIELQRNHIGTEGAKASCVGWSLQNSR